MMDQTIDNYIPIKGYEKFYIITDYGKIKSLDRKVKSKSGSICIKKSKIMKPELNEDGYLSISLRDENGNRKTFLIHRLVALNYIDNLYNLPQVNHINNIKTDNRKDNLKWGTPLSNSREAAKDGLYCPIVGSKNNQAKLNEAQIIFMRKLYNDGEVLQKELVPLFGVCSQVINSVVRKHTWKHI